MRNIDLAEAVAVVEDFGILGFVFVVVVVKVVITFEGLVVKRVGTVIIGVIKKRVGCCNRKKMAVLVVVFVRRIGSGGGEVAMVLDPGRTLTVFTCLYDRC